MWLSVAESKYKTPPEVEASFIEWTMSSSPIVLDFKDALSTHCCRRLYSKALQRSGTALKSKHLLKQKKMIKNSKNTFLYKIKNKTKKHKQRLWWVPHFVYLKTREIIHMNKSRDRSYAERALRLSSSDCHRSGPNFSETNLEHDSLKYSSSGICTNAHKSHFLYSDSILVSCYIFQLLRAHFPPSPVASTIRKNLFLIPLNVVRFRSKQNTC